MEMLLFHVLSLFANTPRVFLYFLRAETRLCTCRLAGFCQQNKRKKYFHTRTIRAISGAAVRPLSLLPFETVRDSVYSRLFLNFFSLILNYGDCTKFSNGCKFLGNGAWLARLAAATIAATSAIWSIFPFRSFAVGSYHFRGPLGAFFRARCVFK